MMARNAQAYFAVGLEAAGRREESETWGSQRVSWREDDAAMVDAAGKRREGRTAEGEMPFK